LYLIYCYWSRFLLYGPYIRAVCTGVKNAPVYAGRIYGPSRIYGRSVHTTRIYGRTAEKHCEQRFLYGPYIRAVYTGDRYALPVHTARTYGPYVRAACTGVKNAPVYTGRKYGTHYPYRIAVLYGPYIRAVYTGIKNTPVCTGRTYGPYLRAVFTGSAYRP